MVPEMVIVLKFKKSKKQEENKNCWLVDIRKINSNTWDLTPSNPNTVEELDNRTPREIISEIERLDGQASEALQKIKELL